MTWCWDLLLKHKMECIKENWERFSDLEKNLALYNQTTKTMQKSIDNIEKKVDWLFNKIDNFILNVDDKYATKEELNKTNTTMSNLIKFWIWAGAALIWTLTKLIYDFIVK